jgi:hypothetical protein
MAGRPIEPIPQDTADAIVAWIAAGKTLRDFCRQDGMPHYSTVYDWLAKDAEFAQRIAHARDCGYDVIADECLQIIDSATDANLGKARVWTRLQLLAKWNPKKYGEKITHAGDETQPLVVKHIGKVSE